MALSMGIGRGFGHGVVGGMVNIERPLRLWMAGLPAIYSVIGDSKSTSDEPRWSPYTCRGNSNWQGNLALYSKGTLQVGNTYAESGKTTKQALEDNRGFIGPGETGLSQIELAAADNSHIVFWQLSTNSSVSPAWPPATDAEVLAVVDAGRILLQAAGKVVVLVADSPGSSYVTATRRMWELHNKLSTYAARTGCGFMVLNSPKVFKKDALMDTAIYGGDGTHPSGIGHAFIGKYLQDQWFSMIGFNGLSGRKRFGQSDAANDPLNHGFTISAVNGAGTPTVGSFNVTGHAFSSGGIVSDDYGHWLRFSSTGPGTAFWNFLFNSPSIVAGQWYLQSMLIRGDAILNASNYLSFKWRINWKNSGGGDITSPTQGGIAMFAPVHALSPIQQTAEGLLVQAVCKAPVGATGYSNQAEWTETGTATGKTIDINNLSFVKLANIDPEIDAYLDSQYLWKV